MQKINLPETLAPEAKEYINEVLATLEQNGIIENVDNAAILMLA